MRRTVRVQRRLDAPPEAVFEVLTDHARYDRFPGVRRAALVKPGEPEQNGLGAARQVWLGPLRFEEEITGFDPPTGFDYLIREVRGLPFSHQGGSVRIAPAGGGSDVVWTSKFEIPIPVVGALLDRIFAWRLEHGFAGVLERSAALAGVASRAAV